MKNNKLIFDILSGADIRESLLSLSSGELTEKVADIPVDQLLGLSFPSFKSAMKKLSDEDLARVENKIRDNYKQINDTINVKYIPAQFSKPEMTTDEYLALNRKMEKLMILLGYVRELEEAMYPEKFKKKK